MSSASCGRSLLKTWINWRMAAMQRQRPDMPTTKQESDTAFEALLDCRRYGDRFSEPDFSSLRLAVADELSLAVESCGIIDQNGLAQDRVRGPRRQQVKEMTVVNAKQRRKIARLAASAGVGMRPVRTPQNPVRIRCDQRQRQRRHIGIIGRAV